MRVTIVDAKEVIFEKTADKTLLPAHDGEICVLDYHEPFLCRLRKGLVRIDDSFAVGINDGVARMSANELIVMVER